MELDPRLRDEREPSDRPIESPYTYPPASAAGSGPVPYALNPIHQQPTSPQQPSNAPPSLAQAGLPYYGIQQTPQQQAQMPPTDPGIANSVPLSQAAGPGGESDTPKRPRACEACRGLKVRCDFDGDAEVCKRCAKAGRECLVTAPNRRRPKKTDTRVAELERRIDVLTATLQETQHAQGGHKRMASDDGFDDAFRNGNSSDFNSEYARKKRRSSYRPEEDSTTHLANGALAGLNNANAHSSAFGGILPFAPDHVHSEYADVIDRGILTNAVAAQIYEHYTNDMARHLPAVVFPSTMTAGGLRKTKPVLFLAILSVASGHEHGALQPTLTREANKALADRVICKGEKSLELVQAMQVLSIWHSSEDQNDTMAFQFIQMASAMAIAMELGGPHLRGNLGVSFISGSSKVASDFNSPEKRRAWLSCYMLSGSTGLPLKQLNLIRWSPLLENTLQLLETSPEATSTDKVLCSWARLQRVMDQAGEIVHLTASPPANPERFQLRERIQAIMKEAQSFADGASVETSYSLKLAAYEINIYCHLIATKVEEIIDGSVTSQLAGQESEKSEQKPKVPTKSYFAAIKGCAAAIHQLMDHFLSYLKMSSQTDFNSLPSFHFARIAYAMVALLCMYFAASNSDSKVTSAIDIKDLKVAEYIPGLLELLRSTATDETKRPAQKFQLIVKMLKAWYERTKDGRRSPIKNEISEMLDLRIQPVDDERSTPRQGYRKLSIHGSKAAEDEGLPSPTSKKAAQSSSTQPQNSNPPSGNTPLDLLSEVATKAPSAQAAQTHNPEWYNNANSYQPYQQPYPTDVAADAEGQGMHAGNGYNGMIIDPALEQAMGMAFGSEGNIFPTFVDDFFGGLQGQAVQYTHWGFPGSGA